MGFLFCSRELVSQGSGTGGAGTKGLFYEYAMSLTFCQTGIQTAQLRKSLCSVSVSIGLGWFILSRCLPRSASSCGAGLAKLATGRCPTRDSGGICGGGICLAIKPGISYSSQPFQEEKQLRLGESPSPLQIKNILSPLCAKKSDHVKKCSPSLSKRNR